MAWIAHRIWIEINLELEVDEVFNDEKYVKEFTEMVKELEVKSVMEIGCKSGELISPLFELGIQVSGLDLNPETANVIKGDIRSYKSRKKHELVFSSGLLELFYPEEIPEIIKSMASISSKYVLNLVPNINCKAYMNCKATTTAEWKDEEAFIVEELESLHKDAGLEIVKSGFAGAEWAKKFGSEPSEPYLVWVLAKKN